MTFSAPDADRFNYLEPEIRAKIKVALGGRVAEEIVLGEISTGAESDIEQLTGLARQMVGRWGMSDALGPIAVIPRDGTGPFLPGAAEVSPQTQELLDDEVRRIVAEAHDEVVTLLTENRTRLDALASALLEHETLDEDDAYAAAGVTRPRTTPTGELAIAARSTTWANRSGPVAAERGRAGYDKYRREFAKLICGPRRRNGASTTPPSTEAQHPSTTRITSPSVGLPVSRTRFASDLRRLSAQLAQQRPAQLGHPSGRARFVLGGAPDHSCSDIFPR